MIYHTCQYDVSSFVRTKTFQCFCMTTKIKPISNDKVNFAIMQVVSKELVYQRLGTIRCESWVLHYSILSDCMLSGTPPTYKYLFSSILENQRLISLSGEIKLVSKWKQLLQEFGMSCIVGCLQRWC